MDWSKVAKVAGNIAKSTVEYVSDDLSKKQEEYDEALSWAEGRPDETLKETYKNTSKAIKKKAIYNELKNRGY